MMKTTMRRGLVGLVLAAGLVLNPRANAQSQGAYWDMMSVGAEAAAKDPNLTKSLAEYQRGMAASRMAGVLSRQSYQNELKDAIENQGNNNQGGYVGTFQPINRKDSFSIGNYWQDRDGDEAVNYPSEIVGFGRGQFSKNEEIKIIAHIFDKKDSTIAYKIFKDNKLVFQDQTTVDLDNNFCIMDISGISAEKGRYTIKMYLDGKFVQDSTMTVAITD